MAGHGFFLSMPEDSPAWGLLSAYAPFECSEAEAEDSGFSLFTLEVSSDAWQLKGEVALIDENSEENMPRIDIYRTEQEGWQFRMSVNHSSPVCCVMDAEADLKRARACVSGTASSVIYGINNSLMLLYALNTAGKATLAMHASVIMCQGRAYLFTARSGTGKSTHSSLWLKHIEGSELMNDDNPVIRVREDGSVIAYGSPWSGKTRCYKNISAPVGAVVRIRRADFNQISRLTVPHAYASLYSSSSGLKHEKTMVDGLHESIARIAVSTPCYVLDCRPDEEAARVCAAELLKQDCGGPGTRRAGTESTVPAETANETETAAETGTAAEARHNQL